jgi:hypothetical protein
MAARFRRTFVDPKLQNAGDPEIQGFASFDLVSANQIFTFNKPGRL